MTSIKDKIKSHAFAAQVLAVMVIVGVAWLGAFLLIKFKKSPERVEYEPLIPLVRAETVKARDIRMVVTGYGTVRAKVSVEIAPEVSGRVVSLNQRFNAGGFIRAGEELLKIDPRDYELAVQQARAAVAEALVQLDLEKAEAQVAREEWRQLNPDTEPTSSLVFREPQIRQAQARLESAKAVLAAAELNLERTSLSLPVDVRIVSETVDPGQYVAVGRAVATAYGVDVMEIALPLADAELAWFDIPDEKVSFDGQGSVDSRTKAIVKAQFGGSVHRWTGYVARTSAEVDEASRLIPVIIEVPEAFERSDSRPPLLPGIFVEVIISGHILKDAIAIPRDAIHNANEVWVVNDGRLGIKTIEIVRADKDFAYAKSGLEDGSVVVLSSLDVVSEGMRVRIRREDLPGDSNDPQPDRTGGDISG